MSAKGGFLTKEGAKVKSWKRRWFALEEGSLRYSKTVTSHALGTIDLKTVGDVVPVERKHKANCFQVPTEGRIYYVYGDTEEDRDDWIKAISNERDKAQGKTKKKVKTAKKRARGKALLEDVSINRDNCLGTGSFGPVFEATFEGQEAAAKLLKCNEGQEEDLSPDLLKGARKWCTVAHPHVAAVYGVHKDAEGSHFLLTEMLGSTLEDSLFDEAQRREDGEDMTPGTKERISVCLQIAEALSALHKAGVVHGDLTSWNIFCTSDKGGRHCKISDYGLASLARFDSRGHFKDGVLVRSKLPVRWCAPEVLKRGAYSAMGDVWAFGVVMWEIFSLHDIPYGVDMANSDIKQTVARRDGERLAQPELCPDAAFELLRKCWAYSRKERPAMKEVVDDLRSLLENVNAHKQFTAAAPRDPRLESVLKEELLGDSENEDTTDDADVDDDSDDDEYYTEDEDEE